MYYSPEKIKNYLPHLLAGSRTLRVVSREGPLLKGEVLSQFTNFERWPEQFGYKVFVDGTPVQSDEMTVWARELRQKAIDAEKKLWFQFRQGNMTGLKIRRQHPVGPYVLDFYCSKAKLALEIDGSSHEFRHSSDARRDGYMLSKGIKTIRMSPSIADENIHEYVEWFREECIQRATERRSRRQILSS